MTPRAEALITQHRSVFQQRLAGKRILIVGASTRAAAESVRRAGGTPVCADLFADLDLQQIATTIPVSRFPDSLPGDVAGLAVDAWFYAGGLENSPATLERLEQSAPGKPLGCSSAAVRAVRDPWRLSEALQSQGFPVLAIRREHDPPLSDGSWMRKPLRGAGGRGVTVWDSTAARTSLAELHYFQQRAAGEIASSVFTVDSSGVQCHGVCRQLIGVPEASPPHAFAWCGGIAPRPASAALLSRLQRLGDVLAWEFGLQGLFGVDLVLDGEDFRVLEVNPRYPASVELFELAARRSLLDPRGPELKPPVNSRSVGKLILYAPHELTAPDWSQWARPRTPWAVVPVRDIPEPGSRIPAGQPVCSLLAAGPNPDACRRRLLARARRWTDRLRATEFAES